MTGRRWLAVLLACAVAVGAHAQAPQPRTPARAAAIDASATASAVLVDIVVRDRRGRPVTDMTAGEFLLQEDDVQQRVGSFTRVVRGAGIGIQVGLRDSSMPTLVSPPSATGAASEDAPAAPLTTALVFDALSAAALGSCQRAALEYLPRNSSSDARVGVFVTEPTARIVQDYTDHPALVRDAVSRVMPTGTSMREQMADARTELRERRNRLESESAIAASATGAQLGTAAGNIAGLEMQRRLVQGQMRMVNAFESLDRDHRGLGTTSALFAVLQTLVELPGRKTLVFFSEGLPASPTLQAHLQSVIEAANRINVTVYAVDANGLRALSGTTETRREIEDAGHVRLGQLAMTRDDAEEPMTRALERAEDLLRFDTQSGLARLADGTGGFLVQDTNDLTQAFRRIDEDMRFHYLLTYEPTNQAMDGRFRRIRVKVTRPGVSVYARSGYRAVRLPPSIPAMDYEGPALAALDAVRPPSAVPFGSAALSFPEPERAGLVLPIVRLGTNDVTFVEDAATGTYHGQATVVVRFRDGAGRIVEKVSQQYQLSGKLSELAAARRGEILFYKEPVLAPGVYTMEAAVHDGEGRRSGVRIATIEVPQGGGTGPRLSSVVIVRRSERVRTETAAPGERALPPRHPLQVGDLLLYPSTGEPVSRSMDKDLAFYFVLYGAPGQRAASEAHLELRRSGQVVSDVPLPLPAADAAGRVTLVARLPLEPLAPGLYELGVRIGEGAAALSRSAFVTIVE